MHVFNKNYIVILALLFFAVACKKEEVKPPVADPPLNISDTFDLALSYNNYVLDSIYANDTIRFDYRITNYDLKTINQNDKLLMAVKLGSTVFALDLIGSGPTEVNVPVNLNQNDFFDKNSGYLLGSSLLAYFAVDSLEVSLMIYGLLGATINENFPLDRTPTNNKAILMIKPNSIELR
jgi:hypothetical protein